MVLLINLLFCHVVVAVAVVVCLRSLIYEEEDSLDDLMFLRAVTTRSGRMVGVVYRE